MKRIIITLCICTAWVASTYAQYPYTLKKCLEEGLANNYSIRITRNEEQISHNNATLANAGYLPTVDLSAGYTGTLDNTDTKSRSTGTTASERNIYDQTLLFFATISRSPLFSSSSRNRIVFLIPLL